MPEAMMSFSGTIEVYRFDEAAGDVPNNPELPLLLYRGAVPYGTDRALAFERLFAGNGWGDGWRNGIYPYHHYHSTAHEVLGIAAGEADVRFGGEGGRTLTVRGGDVVVIPAGVGHKKERASGDLLVVGAYPHGQCPDMCKARDADPRSMQDKIAAVPLPRTDPVQGADGALITAWVERR